ncbi:MAG: tRNA (adenosine(37)-N6)-threonylcarbamoyltransferase complex ATPase subunit type 1 TsaE [Candidatus Omnitrophica bacterium]|nr:tRNA (adenosine(37)-N6)-threonylcarbamoyltransferase complex ATPase subunit type 1 TsaE [Candidatus Omnitrophota bacterium]
MRLISNSVNETLNFGRKLAKKLKAGDIICLFGELGSGKTVLTKGIASGLGVRKGRIISPSFVLIREYSGGRLPVFHFDLYRINSLEDILGLGYEEYFYGNGVTIVEWADRLKSLLPEKFLKIELIFKGQTKRLLKISDENTIH